ncbi:MAG: argininosuccinate lyase, partial [Lentisphaerae bacterium]
MPLWDGRFEIRTNELLTALSESISYDHKLYAQDILGSMVHAEMLGRQGIIPQEDAEKIIEELDRIKGEIEANRFEFREELEDIHMNIEAELI